VFHYPRVTSRSTANWADWEVVETTRRLLLTAVVSVVGIGSAGQVVFGILIAIVYVKLYGYYQPYELDELDVVQEVAQYQVFFTLFVALLLRGNLLPGAAWAQALDVLLVLANLSTITAAVVVYFRLHELDAAAAAATATRHLRRLLGRGAGAPTTGDEEQEEGAAHLRIVQRTPPATAGPVALAGHATVHVGGSGVDSAPSTTDNGTSGDVPHVPPPHQEDTSRRVHVERAHQCAPSPFR